MKILVLIFNIFYMVHSLPAVENPSPNDFASLFYTLSINLEFSNSTFIGQSIIYITSLKDTDVVVLHASENLKDLRVNYLYEDGFIDNYWVVNDLQLDTEAELLYITLDRDIPVGTTFKIALDYNSDLNSEAVGLYQSSYVDDNGQKVPFALTAFSPNHGRKVFPSFDDLSQRGLVQIGIVRDEEEVTISNGKLIGSLPHWEGALDVHGPTPYMPFHLFGFAIGKFDFKASSDGFYQIYGRPQAINNDLGNFALEMVEVLLNAMIAQVAYIYPLENLKILAIPEGQGASNWGFIVGLESNLLYSKLLNTNEDLQATIQYLANAVAQQFFGNLVGPMTWSDNWIFQGFSKYFENRLVDIAMPSLEVSKFLATFTVQEALFYDSLCFSSSFTDDVKTTEKSASLLRMLESVLTTPVFDKAVQNFVRASAFYPTTEEALWAAVEATENASINFPISIAETMRTWTTQLGYPVVIVSRNSDNSITIRQERFYENLDEKSSEIWYVPITYAWSNNPDITNNETKFWLTKKESTIPGLTVNINQWLLLNTQQTGLYRVNYDDSLLSELLQTNFMELADSTTRSQFLDNILAMCKSGRTSYKQCLNHLQNMNAENEYVVWNTFFSHINILNFAMDGLNLSTNFAEYLKPISRNLYQKLGVTEQENDYHHMILLRTIAIKWACSLGVEACLQETEQLFDKPLVPNLEEPIFCGALEYSDDNFNIIMELYTIAEDALKARIVKSAACTNDKTHLTGLLGGMGIDKTHHMLAFKSVYKNSFVGLQLATEYLISHFKDVITRFSVKEIGVILTEIAARTYRDEMINKFQDFLDNLSDSDALFEYPVQFSKYILNNNKAWKIRSYDDIYGFFHNTNFQ